MNPIFKTVCVVGLGYIGLPTAAMLASRGVQVIGLDVNRRIVDTLNNGGVIIVEPYLDELVHSTVVSGKLRATMTPEPADVFIIAVPTPFKGDHEPDVSYVERAVRGISPVLRPGNLVILESTSPVGTTRSISHWIAEERPDLTLPHEAGNEADVQVAHCPERVLPGRIIQELVDNDRIIGGMTPRAADMAAALYEIFVRAECLKTDDKTAELCKLVENSYRDVNIAFANELSLVCEKVGVDVWSLISLANRHPRVNILQPGPGVGGHCIAVDPWFIVHSAPDTARLIRTAREVNDSKPHHVVQRVRDAVAKSGQPKIACFGLAFKADVDDLRESPAVNIVAELSVDISMEVLVVEPHVEELPAILRDRPNIRLVDVATALAEAQIVILLVNHKPFATISSETLSKYTIIDTRGDWSSAFGT
ncbi:UNVERIFIED_ORG: UDP-N-acetyl-D-mannosaminuronic acid dehydrogenase [Shinella zoogloeoides]|nr:UDP-N-acetyl-D-mannosaminuronic acid dehydrogenase [Shinella zoogloeoides]